MILGTANYLGREIRFYFTWYTSMVTGFFSVSLYTYVAILLRPRHVLSTSIRKTCKTVLIIITSMRYFFQTMCFPDARLQDGLLVDIIVQFFFKFGIILKTYFPELHANSHIYLSIITLTVIKVTLMLIFQSPYFVHPERLPSQVCEFIEVNDDANRILNIRSEMFEP